MSSWRLPLSRRRRTIFSPQIVGRTETRKSISLPLPIFSLMRPSCGRRRSAMSSEAMILRRLERAFFSFSGGCISSISTPSMRYRTRSFFSYGSTWMSLAPFLMALRRMALTRRTTGAPSAAFSSSRMFTSSASTENSTSSCSNSESTSSYDWVCGGEGPLQRPRDRRLRRDHGLDVEAGQELDVVDGVEVGRVRHRHDERVARAGEGDDLVLVADLARDELRDLGVDLVLVEVDGRDAVLGGEEVGDLPVRDVPQLGEGEAQVVARLALLLLGLAELLEADELLADEELAEAVLGRHALFSIATRRAALPSTRKRGSESPRSLG